MTIDANENAEKEVLTPSITSDEGVEANLEAQSNAESSSASEENHEEKTTGVQKRINDLTAKRYAAEREAEELKNKLASYEANAQKSVQSSTDEQLKAPELPEDLFDDEAMRKYHADMTKYTSDVAKSAAKASFEDQQKNSLKREQEAQFQGLVETYAKNAVRDGVDIKKLPVIEQTLNQAGCNQELGRFIMSDNNGAKIAEYLVDNPSEMYSILQMDSVSAGIEIATKIKPKVLAQTPKVSNAPEPITDISGGGYIEKDDFDKTYPGYEII